MDKKVFSIELKNDIHAKLRVLAAMDGFSSLRSYVSHLLEEKVKDSK